jgi:hypothetical protein
VNKGKTSSCGMFGVFSVDFPDGVRPLHACSTHRRFAWPKLLYRLKLPWIRYSIGRDAEDLLKGKHPSITTPLKSSHLINHWSSVLTKCHLLHASNSPSVQA